MTTLVFFSGTGNSLAVARLLAGRLGDAKLMPIRALLDQPLSVLLSDAVGYVFPVYCQDAPEIVRRAAKVVQVPAEAYLFGVATHNGDPGCSHFNLDRELKKSGRRLSAGFAVLMPGNSITPKVSTNPAEEQQRRLLEAPARVDEIAAAILKRGQVPFAGSDSLWKRLKGYRNLFRHKFVYRVPEKFWATEACNGCGICARICPENNIRLEAASPNWGTRCQMCQACLHWCPQQAIQNGEGTISRKRYHHPDVTIGDMIASETPL